MEEATPIETMLALSSRVLLLLKEAARSTKAEGEEYTMCGESSLIISIAYRWQWGRAWMPWILMSQIASGISEHACPRVTKRGSKQCHTCDIHTGQQPLQDSAVKFTRRKPCYYIYIEQTTHPLLHQIPYLLYIHLYSKIINLDNYFSVVSLCN